MPARIQRKRTKGWKMPANAVSVTRPGRFGNPFRVSDGSCTHPDCGPKSHPPTTAQKAVDAFRRWIEGHPALIAMVREKLRGRDLACWCKPGDPCHADVLLEIANREEAL
jgi:hypothetical protein